MNPVVEQFENAIAEFYGAPYAVAVDCCTHGVELCVRYKALHWLTVPCRTYLSIPMLAEKLDIGLTFVEEEWKDYYEIYTSWDDESGQRRPTNPSGVIDAAVFWKRDGYIPGKFMCLSFQFQKHLSLGRGGMILTDDKDAALTLKKMSYDGRIPNVPWREQNVDTMGYHYYMTPETAQLGLDKLDEAINTKPREWTVTDWPDLREMEIFK